MIGSMALKVDAEEVMLAIAISSMDSVHEYVVVTQNRESGTATVAGVRWLDEDCGSDWTDKVFEGPDAERNRVEAISHALNYAGYGTLNKTEW
jgi:hypothetical protein